MQTSLTVEPVFDSIWIAVLISIAAVGVLTWATPPLANRTRRLILIGLRLAAGAVLLISLFQPTIVRTDNQPAPGILTIAVDQSLSMTLPDGGGRTRWQTQRSAIESLRQQFSEVDDQRLTLRWVGYAGEATVTDADQLLNSESPDGTQTDLSAAIGSPLTLGGMASSGESTGTAESAGNSESNGDVSPVGIVLMGDGTQTAVSENVSPRSIAQTLDAMGVPLYTVPIGPAASDSARDVAIESLPESYRLFADNEVAIEFVIAAQSVVGADIEVTAEWIDSNDDAEVIAVRQFVPNLVSQSTALSIPVRVPPPGTYQLRVAAAPVDGETVVVNNQQIAFVDVLAGGGRILYLEGSPRSEQLFLRRSLRQFPDLDITYQSIPVNRIRDADGTVVADGGGTWPFDLSRQLGQEPTASDENRPRGAVFDAIILGDVPAAAIGEKQLSRIAELVGSGTGLITLGGTEAYTAGGYHLSELARVLPIELAPNQLPPAATDISTTVAETQSPAGPFQVAGDISVVPNRPHPITDLGGDNVADIWRSLPPMVGANRLGPPRAIPGVTVLLEDAQQRPMMITGEYGSGRVAALAFDSTWRWWRDGRSDVHRRFWRQLMLWVLARENVGGDLIRIEMEQRRMEQSDPSAFTASLETIDENRQVDLSAVVIDTAGNETPIATTSSANAIRGVVPTLDPGVYRLRVSADDQQLPGETAIEPSEMAFQVIQRQIELEQSTADLTALRSLAAITSEHGGQAFSPDRMDELADAILRRHLTSVTPIIERMRLGEGPLSGWILFLIFAGSLTAEWLLRRRWNLV